MWQRTAARLAARAGGSAAGGAGRRVRGAARRLDRAARRDDQRAVDAVWARWLAQPTETLWALLAGWRRPATGPIRGLSLVALTAARPAVAPGGSGPDPRRPPRAGPAGGPAVGGPPAVSGADLVEAFARAGHPVGAAARAHLLSTCDTAVMDEVCAAGAADPAGALAGFCAAHALAPAEPVARAAFLVLTGQHERYRAADPDGALLAAAYAGAGAGERARLRAGLLAAGAADAVRVIAGAGLGRLTRLGRDEIDDLAAGLAGRGDWDGLWRLVGGVSPAQAVALARRFPAGWQPPGDPGRQLFAALTAVPPAALAAVAAPYPLVGSVPRPDTVSDLLRDVSFAPDGSQVAVLDYPAVYESRVTVYALPAVAPVWEYRHVDAVQLGTVTHVGDGTVIGRGRGVYRLTGAGSTELGYARWVAAVPGGFATFHDSTGELSVLPATGRQARVRSPTLGALAEGSASAFAGDPDTGRLAVAGRRGTDRAVALLDPAGGLLATGADPATPATDGAGAWSGAITRWRRDGGALVPAATQRLGADAGHREQSLVVVPGRVGLARSRAWFDTAGLAPAPPPLADDYAWLWSSARGHWLAAEAAQLWQPGDAAGELRLYRLWLPRWLAALVDRPVAAMSPADLPALHDGPAAEGSAVAAVGTAVRACLEYRFGAEVRLGPGGGTAGSAGATGAGPTDWRLGGRPGGPPGG